MKSFDNAWRPFAVLVMALPMQTMAQTFPGQAAPESAVATSMEFDKPVAMATLESYRGGTQLVVNDMQLAGTTSGNSATQVVTGSNAISAGSFANMSGLPVVIQNSGANVLIQNAVIVHVQMN